MKYLMAAVLVGLLGAVSEGVVEWPKLLKEAEAHVDSAERKLQKARNSQATSEAKGQMTFSAKESHSNEIARCNKELQEAQKQRDVVKANFAKKYPKGEAQWEVDTAQAEVDSLQKALDTAKDKLKIAKDKLEAQEKQETPKG